MRHNKRSTNSIRKIKIKVDYIKNAYSSCLMEMGETKVICSASVEEGVPRFLRGKGKGWITAEYGMLPASCVGRVSREATIGKKSGRTHEVQRLIGRSLRAVCDTHLLGERTIWIDCDVIQADGGTRCASITGGFIALALALDKMKNRGVLETSPLKGCVAAVSAGIVNGKVCVDLDYGEDSTAEVDMNVVMKDSKEFIEIQGTAEGDPFTREQLDKIIDLAGKGIKQIEKEQKKILKNIGVKI